MHFSVQPIIKCFKFWKWINHLHESTSLYHVVYCLITYTQLKKIRGTCFWSVCHVPQNNTAHPGILPTKPLFFTVEVYKRTMTNSRSFTEHKRKCSNRGENKAIIVHQGGFYLSWRNTKKYHVFAPMGRFQLESIYLYFPPSSQLLYLCFCPVGLSLL